MGKPPESPNKRTRLDWDAIKRDYRTGQFTDRELAAKHNTHHTTIVRHRKEDLAKDPSSWRKDLSEEVRAATNALLDQALVTKIAKDQHQDATEKVTTVVLAAAEANKQIILGHREELAEARSVANALLAELKQSAMLADHFETLAKLLAGEDAEPKDAAEARRTVARALGLGSRVSSIKALSEAMTKLHAGERQAFGMDQPDKEKEAGGSLGKLLSQLNRSSVPVARELPPDDAD